MTVSAPPRGRQVFRWLGPGFLWMVSAAGSGELLFTPRVGSMYGYALVWALIAAVLLKFFINREIGRFAVCMGRPLLDGFSTLRRSSGWLLWFILVPQLFVAVISIAGLGGGAATALTLLLPGSDKFWMVVSVAMATALVLIGKYKGVEKAALTLASILALASIVAAVSVSPSVSDIVAGLKPQFPEKTDIAEILPWLGFMMSGAAGLMWYSYWIPAKKYGMAGAREGAGEEGAASAAGGRREDARGNEGEEAGVPALPDLKHTSSENRKKLKGWIRMMTIDTGAAVIGTVIITLAFLILGAELLRPQGLVPEENRVAEILGKLLGSLWGPVGFWFMVLGVFIGFWDTVLSDQDGHSRLFANGARHVLPQRQRQRWSEKQLKGFFVIVLVTVLPILLYLLIGNPVELLKISGAIEAAHIPVVAALTLYFNRKYLPRELQPSAPVFVLTVLAALFFTGFAVLYLLELMGMIQL